MKYIGNNVIAEARYPLPAKRTYIVSITDSELEILTGIKGFSNSGFFKGDEDIALLDTWRVMQEILSHKERLQSQAQLCKEFAEEINRLSSIFNKRES